jgi:hypothetical protein
VVPWDTLDGLSTLFNAHVIALSRLSSRHIVFRVEGWEETRDDAARQVRAARGGGGEAVRPPALRERGDGGEAGERSARDRDAGGRLEAGGGRREGKEVPAGDGQPCPEVPRRWRGGGRREWELPAVLLAVRLHQEGALPREGVPHGHTIYLLPPVTLVNMLPTDVELRIGGWSYPAVANGTVKAFNVSAVDGLEGGVSQGTFWG